VRGAEAAASGGHGGTSGCQPDAIPAQLRLACGHLFNSEESESEVTRLQSGFRILGDPRAHIVRCAAHWLWIREFADARFAALDWTCGS
jgi:hypothetical protein